LTRENGKRIPKQSSIYIDPGRCAKRPLQKIKILWVYTGSGTRRRPYSVTLSRRNHIGRHIILQPLRICFPSVNIRAVPQNSMGVYCVVL
jgi:hypothetical protein